LVAGIAAAEASGQRNAVREAERLYRVIRGMGNSANGKLLQCISRYRPT
jgi:hypothetical protein